MFVNKEMFSIQSSSNFAHADQVAPLEMAVQMAHGLLSYRSKVFLNGPWSTQLQVLSLLKWPMACSVTGLRSA